MNIFQWQDGYPNEKTLLDDIIKEGSYVLVHNDEIIGSMYFAIEDDESYEILTSPDDFNAVSEALDSAGIKPVSAEVTKLPQNTVTLTSEEDIKNINKILDMLDEDDER